MIEKIEHAANCRMYRKELPNNGIKQSYDLLQRFYRFKQEGWTIRPEKILFFRSIFIEFALQGTSVYPQFLRSRGYIIITVV